MGMRGGVQRKKNSPVKRRADAGFNCDIREGFFGAVDRDEKNGGRQNLKCEISKRDNNKTGGKVEMLRGHEKDTTGEGQRMEDEPERKGLGGTGETGFETLHRRNGPGKIL